MSNATPSPTVFAEQSGQKIWGGDSTGKTPEVQMQVLVAAPGALGAFSSSIISL